jgi:hypothetical protein
VLGVTEARRLGWEQVFSHQIFQGCFDAELKEESKAKWEDKKNEPKLKKITSEVREYSQCCLPE